MSTHVWWVWQALVQHVLNAVHGIVLQSGIECGGHKIIFWTTSLGLHLVMGNDKN